MPIPAETKINHNVDRWDDEGEYIGNEFHMVHVPCPTSHVGQTVLEEVEARFQLRETKYDAIDGGHAVFVMEEGAVDPEAVAEAAEAVRDNAREQHGVGPYDAEDYGIQTDTDDTDDQPRYIQ